LPAASAAQNFISAKNIEQLDVMAMREIPASEAKIKFVSLLDDVVRGETIAISRRGRLVARLAPARDPTRAASALAAIAALRGKTKVMTAAEILAARDDGRRIRPARAYRTP